MKSMAELNIQIDFTDLDLHINEYVKSCFQALLDSFREQEFNKEEVIEALESSIDEFDQRIALCRAQQILK